MEDTFESKNPDLSPEETATQSHDPLTACQQELSDAKNRYLYLNAEFDNYRKRIQKEQASWSEYAQDQSLLDIISIMSDLERAVTELESQTLPPEAVAHFKGFNLILKNLETLLKKYGIEEIPTTKEFDPECFEAVMQQESETHASGEIMSVLQKGYRRHARIIKPAKVIVSK